MTNTSYRVKPLKDDIWEVIKITSETDAWEIIDEESGVEESVYQGRLSDCESFIRLTEGGYMY